MLKISMNSAKAIITILSMLGISLSLASPMAIAQTHNFMLNNHPLNNEELFEAFSGVRHDGYYRFDREEIPTHEFSETTFEDGRVEHYQGVELLKGYWNIKDNRICFRYEKIWQRELCYDIYRVGTCYYHYIRSSGGRAVSGWTARSTPSTETADCDAQIS